MYMRHERTVNTNTSAHATAQTDKCLPCLHQQSTRASESRWQNEYERLGPVCVNVKTDLCVISMHRVYGLSSTRRHSQLKKGVITSRRTAKARISMCIRAVWSRPLLIASIMSMY